MRRLEIIENDGGRPRSKLRQHLSANSRARGQAEPLGAHSCLNGFGTREPVASNHEPPGAESPFRLGMMQQR